MTSGSGGTTSDDGDTDEVPPMSPPAALTGSATEDPGASTAGSSTAPRSGEAKKARPLWQETLILVATAVVLALLIKTFFVQAFYIPSGSMRDTLKVNDRILVQKVSYWFGDVQRGDIVVFDDPANWLGEENGTVASNPVTKVLSVIGLYPSGGHLVKRVIGVGGDAVSCKLGKVEVNGVALREAGYVTLAQQACDGSWSVVVPADHIWVLGDNRQQSADSRAHLGDPGGGFIPVHDIVGKVFVVVWPLDHWQLLSRPGTFSNPALDQAAGIISGTAPVGLALLAVPPLLRRRQNRNARR